MPSIDRNATDDNPLIWPDCPFCNSSAWMFVFCEDTDLGTHDSFSHFRQLECTGCRARGPAAPNDNEAMNMLRKICSP